MRRKNSDVAVNVTRLPITQARINLGQLAKRAHLHREYFITESVWAELTKHFNEQQRMDVVFAVGQYTQVSMLLNTFGVQLDEGQTLDPDLRQS